MGNAVNSPCDSRLVSLNVTFPSSGTGIVLFPLLAVTEEIAELVDIKDAVADVVFESLGDDAPLVGLESNVAIITGVSVDSLVVVGWKIVCRGMIINGRRGTCDRSN